MLDVAIRSMLGLQEARTVRLRKGVNKPPGTREHFKLPPATKHFFLASTISRSSGDRRISKRYAHASTHDYSCVVVHSVLLNCAVAIITTNVYLGFALHHVLQNFEECWILALC